MEVPKTERNFLLMRTINELKTKGLISCDYVRENAKSCKEGAKENLITSLDCSLLLSDAITVDGDIQTQSQQKKQQQQQPQNMNTQPDPQIKR